MDETNQKTAESTEAKPTESERQEAAPVAAAAQPEPAHGVSSGELAMSVSDSTAPLVTSVDAAESPAAPNTLGRSEPVKTVSWTGTVRYENPWDTWNSFFNKLGALARWKCGEAKPSTPAPSEAEKELPVVKLDDIQKELELPLENNQLRVTWLGHASVLLQFQSANVLCDPVFAERIGPVKMPGLSHLRYRPPPLTVDELPPVHAVVISHNHYDHLDLSSVQDLHRRFGDGIKWFVPMGLKQWMCGVGIAQANVEELMWWEEKELKTSGDTLKMTLTPTQHWCTRTAWDKNQSLWGSWAVCNDRVKTWFGGDTGYCPTFKEIGEHFGGFDFAAIPIGAFLPREVMKDQHVSPEESVKIHQDIKSKKSLGIHWGTFTMGCVETYLAPRDVLAEELEKVVPAIPKDEFFVLNHGQSKLITT